MKTPVWSVKAAQPRNDYTILLKFADGTKRIYDAKQLLDDSLYARLNDLDFFMKAHAKYGSVVWTDNLDIAPEHLYECSKIIE